ncbi:MAG: hypothetical protein AAF745_19415 [Planctomycetota bacterium]
MDRKSVEHYYIRIGCLGEIRVASALIPLSRGDRVVVRSPRGLELADIVSKCGSQPGRQPSSSQTNHVPKPIYRIMRPANASDDLLAERLDRHKRDAIEACRAALAQSGSKEILLDVDQCLDGGTLFMHFLGDPDSQARDIADQVASEYQAVIRTDHLATLLSDGCGPDCGTGGGCSGSCSGCQSSG